MIENSNKQCLKRERNTGQLKVKTEKYLKNEKEQHESVNGYPLLKWGKSYIFFNKK